MRDSDRDARCNAYHIGRSRGQSISRLLLETTSSRDSSYVCTHPCMQNRFQCHPRQPHFPRLARMCISPLHVPQLMRSSPFVSFFTTKFFPLIHAYSQPDALSHSASRQHRTLSILNHRSSQPTRPLRSTQISKERINKQASIKTRCWCGRVAGR